MTVQNFCLLETIAKMVIRKTDPGHEEDLLELLSGRFLQTMITNRNIDEIRSRINELRFSKEELLAIRGGLSPDWQANQAANKKFQQLMDTPVDKLSPPLELIRREIRFLDTLIRSIHGLRFVKRT